MHRLLLRQPLPDKLDVQRAGLLPSPKPRAGVRFQSEDHPRGRKPSYPAMLIFFVIPNVSNVLTNSSPRPQS